MARNEAVAQSFLFQKSTVCKSHAKMEGSIYCTF